MNNSSDNISPYGSISIVCPSNFKSGVQNKAEMPQNISKGESMLIATRINLINNHNDGVWKNCKTKMVHDNDNSKQQKLLIYNNCQQS